jgi:hypothetical protein
MGLEDGTMEGYTLTMYCSAIGHRREAEAYQLELDASKGQQHG